MAWRSYIRILFQRLWTDQQTWIIEFGLSTAVLGLEILENICTRFGGWLCLAWVAFFCLELLTAFYILCLFLDRMLACTTILFPIIISLSVQFYFAIQFYFLQLLLPWRLLLELLSRSTLFFLLFALLILLFGFLLWIFFIFTVWLLLCLFEVVLANSEIHFTSRIVSWFSQFICQTNGNKHLPTNIASVYFEYIDRFVQTSSYMINLLCKILFVGRVQYYPNLVNVNTVKLSKLILYEITCLLLW